MLMVVAKTAHMIYDMQHGFALARNRTIIELVDPLAKLGVVTQP